MNVQDLFDQLIEEPQRIEVDQETFDALVKLQMATHNKLVVTRDDKWVIGNSLVTPPYAKREQR